jgi:glycosyltransferase involved in cell wall biosynthesis
VAQGLARGASQAVSRPLYYRPDGNDMNTNRSDERVQLSDDPNLHVMFLLSSLKVGGSERKTVRLANAFAAGKRQVAIAYLSPPESLLVHVDPAVAPMNLRRRGKFSIKALRRLVRTIREANITTLVAVNLYPALYAVLARLVCRERPLRVVVSVNTTEFVSLKEKLQMLLYRHILQRADLVIFGAERQRRLWGARYGLDRTPDKTVVLHNGVDAAEFSRARVAPAATGGSGSRVMLGTVGAFRVEKAQVDLVRAVYELMVRGADVGAIIVGDGPERPKIEREIQRLGVDRRVRLVGEVQDVRPYLAIMDIFVLPSVAVETFSNAVLEAMAMSCPVVVARVGGMDEMLQFGGGMMYAPGDVQSLCDLLMPLVANAYARRKLGEEACKAVEGHFSFDRMVNDFKTRVLGTG